MNPASPSVRALLDALEEPALLVEDQQTVAANAAALDLLGEDIAGRNIRLAIRQPQALQTILAGQSADLEISGIGGLERRWGLQVRPLGNDLLLVRLADRSAMRAAEKMRVDFVANASHELRTPLATIIGYAETLAEDGELPSELRSRFGRLIHDEARRMLRIIEDLMSLSRIEADRYVQPSGRVSIAEIVRLACENGRHLAESRGCRIEAEIEHGLPDVSGDFTQLLQVADNLLANAIRYGCSDRSPEVTISARAEQRDVLLSVRDRGDGIPAIHIPRLTERFYRVDAARSRDSGGTGLGLAIVKHIVERHRGSLTIVSKPDEGTDVQVRLPLSSN
jgi:two-component system, OmpR family, phosphate regulon sensor histidine kinase PhoR